MSDASRSSLNVAVVTPEGSAFEGTAESVVVPGHDGEVAFLRGHAPFVGAIGCGELRVKTPEGEMRRWYLEGGVAQVLDDDVAILADGILPAADVDAAQAQKDLDEALATDNDLRFAAIVPVLRRLGRLDAPGRDLRQFSRMRLIELRTTRSATNPAAAAQTRRMILKELILAGEHDPYVYEACSIALEDEDPSVRELGAVLAVRMDYAILKIEYLQDDDARVRTRLAVSAAFDAAIYGLSADEDLPSEYWSRFTQPGDTESLSGRAFYLAVASPREYSKSSVFTLPSSSVSAFIRRPRKAIRLPSVASGSAKSSASLLGLAEPWPRLPPRPPKRRPRPPVRGQ